MRKREHEKKRQETGRRKGGEKFEEDFESLTHQPFDSQNLIISKVPKVGERGLYKK